MASGPAQEVKQRALVASALKRLAADVPLADRTLSGKQLFPSAWKRDGWAAKLLRRLVVEGVAKQVGSRPVLYYADAGALDRYLDDQDELTWLIWPGQRPVLPSEPERPFERIVGAMPDFPEESDEDEEPTDRDLLEANLKLSSALFEHAQVMTASLEGVRNELAELRKLWE